MWTSSILHYVCKITNNEREWKVQCESVTAEEVTCPSLVCPVYKTVLKPHMKQPRCIKLHTSHTQAHIHGHLFLPEMMCQVFLILDNVFFPELLVSQLCADRLCTCVFNNKRMSSSLIRGQVSTWGMKSDARPPLLLCIFCSMLSTLNMAFSFVWWTVSRFQVNYPVVLFKRYNRRKKWK